MIRVIGKRGGRDIRACVFVKAPDAESLIIDQADGYSAEACGNLALNITDTIAGETYESLTTRYCEDTRDYPGYKDHPKRRRDYRSVVCIPIKSGNRIYGILNVDAIPRKAFYESDIRVLEVLAELAALSYIVGGSATHAENREETGKD